MDTQDWIRGIRRIPTRSDLPITIQGGEPTLHHGFYDIMRAVGPAKHIDLLTNFQVDYNKWEREISPRWFRRGAKYPSIRVSYHPGQSSILGLFTAVYRATRRGYPIGIWAVDYPPDRLRIRILQRVASMIGIEFRKKEFLGWYDHSLYGEYKYEDSIYQTSTRDVDCRSQELLIAPDGYIHRCHADLYAGRNPTGHILDPKLPELGKWRPCSNYGHCNACDIKMKTDRFQRQGFCSVEISPLTNARR